jgi:hypothetical protein
METRHLVRVVGLLGCLGCAAPVAARQAGPQSVVTFQGGSIYHRPDCISLSGHVRVEVPDREGLGPRAVACSICKTFNVTGASRI